MKYFLFLWLAFPWMAQAQEEAIREVLNEQVSCWNKGDLECYMEGYWQSEQLMFVGKNGVTYGWKPTLERYQKSYPNKAQMGVLTLGVEEIYPLSEDYWFVMGKWALKRNAGDLAGRFTLLVREIEGEWKIVVDHSS